jgi:hypothetical protein
MRIHFERTDDAEPNVGAQEQLITVRTATDLDSTSTTVSTPPSNSIHQSRDCLDGYVETEKWGLRRYSIAGQEGEINSRW